MLKRTWLYAVATLIFNTAIAVVLTLLAPGAPFFVEFVFSQSIGFSVFAAIIAVVAFVRSGLARLAVLCVALPLGVAFGITMAFLLSGVGGWSDQHVSTTLAIGLFFGMIGAVVFLLFERLKMEVERRRHVQGEGERREIEARLKMLQAQIEPHFLFNTLANVSGLIDNDPALAKKLLAHLNDWLRVALVRARCDSATLGDELDMLENYLQILKIRFGERLRWRVEATQEARGAVFPPMLLQPLVENAVRHGIEPKIGGGEIVVRGSVENGKLHCEVCDDGVGIQDSVGGGAGVANVRERLVALFGEQGALGLHNGAHGGTVATLELPAKGEHESDHRR